VVDECLGAGDDDQENRLVDQVVFDAERRTEGADKESPGANVDGAEDGDQAEQIEPRRDPASAPVSEYRAPVIGRPRSDRRS
jgi:hypothetical protein